MRRVSFVTPKVELIAETRLVEDVNELLKKLIEDNPDASEVAVLSEFAGRACYQSWDNPSGKNTEEYIANINDHKHFSVLEHGGFTLYLTGVSRSFTHELIRHRHLSPSQLSQRFFDESDANFVVPPLFRGHERAEAVLHHVAEFSQYHYGKLVDIAYEILAANKRERLSPRDKRKRAREAARCVLTNMTETRIVITGNHRSWQEVFEKRGGPEADAEFQEIVVMIFLHAKELAPEIYQEFYIDEHGYIRRQTNYVPKDELAAYLDNAIRMWREQKNAATTEDEQHTAACYVDAFQSVRQSLLGEALSA